MKPETLSEARAWDARRDAYAESGMSDKDAAAAAWNQPAEEEPVDAYQNARLLKMLQHEGDAKMVKDLDCYPCGACRQASCFVCEYAKARKRAPKFNGKNYLANNHRQIPELTLARIKALAEPKQKTKQATCQHCQRPFLAQRSTAKWCSARCRVAGNAAA